MTLTDYLGQPLCHPFQVPQVSYNAILSGAAVYEKLSCYNTIDYSVHTFRSWCSHTTSTSSNTRVRRPSPKLEEHGMKNISETPSTANTNDTGFSARGKILPVGNTGLELEVVVSDILPSIYVQSSFLPSSQHAQDLIRRIISKRFDPPIPTGDLAGPEPENKPHVGWNFAFARKEQCSEREFRFSLLLLVIQELERYMITEGLIRNVWWNLRDPKTEHHLGLGETKYIAPNELALSQTLGKRKERMR